MKKSIFLLMALAASSAWAKHYFNICYYNWSNHKIGYNNGSDDKKGNKVSKDNFRDRGTVVGVGEIDANQNKCFQASDETIFLPHRLSFVVANQLFAVMNPAFSKPYVVSQNATTNSKGKIGNKVDGNGHDQYYLDIHIMQDGQTVLSSSPDPKDTASYITPAIK